jgi:ribosomal-protein-alanine N-acetyltransferase
MAAHRIARAAPGEAEALAKLAAVALAGSGRLWSAGEIRAFAMPPRGLALADAGRRAGLLLLGLAPGEAEVLEIAVAPAARRQGLARALLAAAHAHAARAGAERVLLEVAEDNAPARALYSAAGYAQIGTRPAYYPRAGGRPADALLLSRPLAAARATG